MRPSFLLATMVAVLGLLASADEQGLSQKSDSQGENKKPFILPGDYDPVRSVAFTADGKTLVVAGKEGTILFWDLATGKERSRLKAHPDDLVAFAMSRDGKTVATATHMEVTVWNTETGKGRTLFKPPTTQPYALALTGDGKTLATASNPPFNDKPGDLMLWDVETGKQTITLNGVASPIYRVAFSADGTTVAAGCRDKTVRLWETANGKEKGTLKGHTDAVGALAFSPDGKILASAGHFNFGDKTIRLWDIMSDREKARLEGQKGMVSAIGFSPDGKTLASVGLPFLGSVWLWDVTTGKIKLTLRRPAAGFFESVAFSPDGNTLAAGAFRPRDTKHGMVALWQLSGTGEQNK